MEVRHVKVRGDSCGNIERKGAKRLVQRIKDAKDPFDFGQALHARNQAAVDVRKPVIQHQKEVISHLHLAKS